MNKDELNRKREETLKKIASDYNVNFDSLNELLKAEKTKKLFKQKAFMQQKISNLISQELDEN